MSSSDYIPASRVLNFTKQNLRRVAQVPCPFHTSEVAVLNVDQNSLSTLSGVEKYSRLIQLSACENNLVRIEAMQNLKHLVTLNLQGNSIMELVGLQNMPHLQWANLARNGIRSMEGLGSCVKLGHLDLSENCIADFSDMSSLTRLKVICPDLMAKSVALVMDANTLLLHGNVISKFQSIPECLPKSLHTLSLAENEVPDLNQVCYLNHLPELEQVSLLSNPCVSITESSVFDYRPYILYWCPRLTILDGMDVTPHERKPYPFALGEHHLLVNYLTSMNPLKDVHPAASSPLSKLKYGGYEEQKTKQSPAELVAPPQIAAEKGVMERNSQASSNIQSPGRLSKTEHQRHLTATNTTASSMAELQSLLSKSSGAGNKTSLAEKLRALQLVEDLIAEQEEVVRTSGEEGHVMVKPSLHTPNELPTETAITTSLTLSISQQVGEGSPTKNLLPTAGDRSKRSQTWNALSRDLKHDSDTRATSGSTVSPRKGIGVSAESKSREEEEIHKLTDKLSKRHSGVPRRENGSSRIAARFDYAATTAPTHMPEALDLQGTLGKKQNLQGGNDKPKTEAHADKTISASTVQSIKQFENESSLSFVTATELTATHKVEETPTTSLLHLESTLSPIPLNSSTLIQKLEGSTQTEQVDDSVASKATNSQQTSTMVDINSLLSSIDQAYGFSSLMEKSKLLSSLMGSTGGVNPGVTLNSSVVGVLGVDTRKDEVGSAPVRVTEERVDYDKKAVCIQAWMKGSISRRKYKNLLQQTKAATRIQALWRGYVVRKRNPLARVVRAELSRIKMESYAGSLHNQLTKCQQELQDQKSLLKLQGESIKVLLEEVRLVQGWCAAREMKEKRRAAIVIQKRWRGYLVRKRNPDCVRGGVSAAAAVRPPATCTELELIQQQLDRLHAALAPLQAVNGGELQTQSTPSIDLSELPCARNVVMTCHSDTCVLLKWTPPTDPPSHLNLQRLGYRVYVDGIPEGMVGPTKQKAYIEGLDHGPIYRFTVRVVYTLGESLDSNSIIASLSNEHQPDRLSIQRTAPGIANHSHSPLPMSKGRENLDKPRMPGFQEAKPAPAKSCDYSISHQQAHSTGGAPNKQLSGGCHGKFECASPVQLDGSTEVPSATTEGSYMHKASHIRLEGDQTCGENVAGDTKGDDLIVPTKLEQHVGGDIREENVPVSTAGSGASQSNNLEFNVSGTGKHPPTSSVGLLGQFKQSTDKQDEEANTSAVQLPGATVPSTHEPPRLGPLFASLPPKTIPPFENIKTSNFPMACSKGDSNLNSQESAICTEEFLSPTMSGLSCDGFLLGKTKQPTFFDPEGYSEISAHNGSMQHAQRLLVSNGPLLTESAEFEHHLQVPGTFTAWGNVAVPITSTSGDSSVAPAMEPSEAETESMLHIGALEATILQEASCVQQALAEAGNGKNPIPTPASPTTNTPRKQVSLGGGNSSANSNVCKLEGCGLTSTSRTGSQQCFDVDGAEQQSPRMGSDWIRPLEQSVATMAPGATSDAKHSRSPVANAVSHKDKQLEDPVLTVEKKLMPPDF